MDDFKEKALNAVETAILKLLQQSSWIQPDYNSRFKVPAEYLQEIWNSVDHKKIQESMARRIEQELADRICNHLAAEIATDVKQLLSIPERREAIRAVARENFDRICKP